MVPRRKPKAKNSQPTIAKTNATNPTYEEWKNKYFFYGTKKMSAANKKNLAKNIIDTVISDPTIKVFNEVLRRNFTTANIVNTLLETSQELSDAKDYAMFVIGVNRELAALEGNPSGNVFTHMQGTYDPKWKAQEEYFNDLKQKAASNSNAASTFIVVKKDVDEMEKELNDEKRDQSKCGTEDTP